MPIFDYECPKCGHKSEELISSADNTEEVKCEKCKSVMERQFPKSVAFRMTDNFKMGRDKDPEPEIAKKLDQIKTGEIEDPYGQWRDKSHA